jgi:hypothetical protein
VGCGLQSRISLRSIAWPLGLVFSSGNTFISWPAMMSKRRLQHIHESTIGLVSARLRASSSLHLQPALTFSFGGPHRTVAPQRVCMRIQRTSSVLDLESTFGDLSGISPPRLNRPFRSVDGVRKERSQRPLRQFGQSVIGRPDVTSPSTAGFPFGVIWPRRL